MASGRHLLRDGGIGFTALNRDTSMAEQKGETERIERAPARLRRGVLSDRDHQGQQALERHFGLSSATATKSVEFCDHFKDLEARISKANLVLSQGQAKEADPQAALISRIAARLRTG